MPCQHWILQSSLTDGRIQYGACYQQRIYQKLTVPVSSERSMARSMFAGSELTRTFPISNAVNLLKYFPIGIAAVTCVVAAACGSTL